MAPCDYPTPLLRAWDRGGQCTCILCIFVHCQFQDPCVYPPVNVVLRQPNQGSHMHHMHHSAGSPAAKPPPPARLRPQPVPCTPPVTRLQVGKAHCRIINWVPGLGPAQGPTIRAHQMLCAFVAPGARSTEFAMALSSGWATSFDSGDL